MVTLRLRQASFSASSATSNPILLRNLKQSVTVLAALYTWMGGAVLAHGLDAVAVRGAAQPCDPQRRVTLRWGRRRFWQGDPDLVRELGADRVELQRAQQAQHRLGHPLAHLDQRLVLGDFGVGHSIQAACEPLQLARLVQPDQQLGRPAVLAHIRGPQHGLTGLARGTRNRRPLLIGSRAAVHLTPQHFQRLSLLLHVVVAVVVPSLHAGQTVGLHVTADLAVDAVGRVGLWVALVVPPWCAARPACIVDHPSELPGGALRVRGGSGIPAGAGRSGRGGFPRSLPAARSRQHGARLAELNWGCHNGWIYIRR